MPSTSAAFTRSEDPAPCPQPALSPPLPSCSRPSSSPSCEGYGAADLGTDALAGLTVAIVAMPLSMAIAVASGVTPERGLYTAIGGGFIVSLLSGSRFQIGGPAGAFIVLVASAAGGPRGGRPAPATPP